MLYCHSTGYKRILASFFFHFVSFTLALMGRHYALLEFMKREPCATIFVPTKKFTENNILKNIRKRSSFAVCFIAKMPLYASGTLTLARSSFSRVITVWKKWTVTNNYYFARYWRWKSSSLLTVISMWFARVQKWEVKEWSDFN